ncbi:glycosyltransferase family 1 protein [Rhodoferax sp.]|uniref:glycosyltransferase family 4 protein n=1 Tax=Rhodoferax sp. TaxID=50421 RepID=UPI0025F337B4|nr:glycosyltransferase family 1 protein [Rhodoferax sp.]
MRPILIDITRLVDRFLKQRLPTGVDRVSLAYIAHYGRGARAVLRYAGGKFVYREAESTWLFGWLLDLGRGGSPLATILKGLLSGVGRQQVAGHFLFNTGHSGLDQAHYPAMLRSQGVRPIFVLHDLIPLTHPEFCRADEQARHLVRMRNAIELASGIVCNSQDTQEALASLCERLDWRMPPTVAALLAPNLPGAAVGPRPLPGPYFVYVSTIEPRKNHYMLLQVWQRLVQKLGPQAPRLVLIGQRGWDNDHIVALLERSDELKGYVVELGRCPDAEMATYLRHTQAMLFPSFAEGYGMPVIEALADGVPVIAADLPVYREFAHGIPDYLDPLDAMGWAAIIEAYAADNSPHRQAQLARLQGFESPTWTQHFRQVDDFLVELSATQPASLHA